MGRGSETQPQVGENVLLDLFRAIRVKAVTHFKATQYDDITFRF